MSFGKELKRMRMKRNLSQDLMAQSLGVSQSSYNNIERDQTSPESQNMHSILSNNFLTTKEQATLVKEFKEMITKEAREVNFGSELRKFRLLKGLKGKEFAENLGIKSSTYQGLESGRLSANSGSARKLVESKSLSEEEKKKLQKYIPKKSKKTKKKIKRKPAEVDIRPEVTKEQRMEYRRRKNIKYFQERSNLKRNKNRKIKQGISRSSVQKVFY